jgi:hypothetical protein
MKSTQKRYLITSDQYDRLNKRSRDQATPSSPTPIQHITVSDPYDIPHPSAKEASETSQRIRSTLQSPYLSEVDRTLMHAQELTKYLQNIRDALTVPKAQAYLGNSINDGSVKQTSPPPPPPPSSPPSSQSTPITPTSANNTITATPKKKRNRKRNNKSTPKTLLQSPLATQPTPPMTPAVNAASPSTPTTIAPTPSRVTTKRFASLPVYAPDRLINDLGGSDPSTRERVAELVDRLQNGSDVTWNQRTGKVHFKNKPLPSSNIKSVLADALDERRHLSNQSVYTTVVERLLH